MSELIKIHIEKRKREIAILTNYKAYTDILHADNAMSDEVYHKLNAIINNRWYYLEKSISDHEKLIKS